jgi:acetyl-CoA carboxylase biotin carboxylase subunit
MFRRILVANRGEIAARVLRACRALGIRTVAVHSTVDAASPHLELADETVCIGGPRPRESYLNAEAILQAAEQTHSQAIHPGYGFLAENALFAERCAAHRITFIGPPAGAIRTMGDKVEARRAMKAAGIPVIPGSDGALASVDEAARVAARVGYPVMIKAVAGGGGRGMRRCKDEEGLRSAFPEAAAEAGAAFGNPALYLEKFIDGGRHIEFQILADGYGSAIHLAERECSIQRHHQKLIEEAPSPVIGAVTRAELGATVASAAARIGYTGAGTMEFLRDPKGSLHFMEMNTRLQVEHPVTEEITGIDIVREQIRIAAGERLSIAQEDVRLSGHAIECRINAEDPSDGFRPAPGTLRAFAFPETGARGTRLRLDTHVKAGYTVPPFYDSMVAKVIVHGPDRPSAIRAMIAALRAATIEGIPTTVPFQLRVLEDGEFADGSYDVGTVARLLASDDIRGPGADRAGSSPAASGTRSTSAASGDRSSPRVPAASGGGSAPATSGARRSSKSSAASTSSGKSKGSAAAAPARSRSKAKG